MNILGLGIDTVDIARFRKAVEKNRDFEKKILSEKEINYCRSKKNYILHMAGRFAAKEAVYKAVNKYTGKTAFKDMEILSGDTPPELADSCALGMALKKKGIVCRISISHNRGQAVANAILEGREI